MLLSLLFLLPTNSWELVGGSLTYHIIDGGAAQAFSNKLSPDGRLINNPIYGIQYVTESDSLYETIGIFSGDDSVGDPILGMKYSTGYKYNHWYLGLVLGAYEQSTMGFTNRGIQPFEFAQIGDVGIVPLIGGEVNYRVNLSQSMYVKLNNLISPIITNTTISLGYSF